MTDYYCNECGYWRGEPNQLLKGKWVFVCSSCEHGWDDSEEKAEARMGA